MRRFNSLFSMKMLFATHGVVSLKRLLNHSILENGSSKLIKKSLEAYFFTSKGKIVFFLKHFKAILLFTLSHMCLV